jgi:hypothetical protein
MAVAASASTATGVSICSLAMVREDGKGSIEKQDDYEIGSAGGDQE